jgi:hypothetical protein
MFDHELNAVKGWPSPYALDKSGPMASGEETLIKAGMVVSLDGTGKFVRGCPNGAMPIFAFPNGGDYDVNSDVGNISGGTLVGLVATGAYELETTEFVGQGFDPNVALTPATGGDLGKVAPSDVCGTDMIVGVCSSAPFASEFKHQGGAAIMFVRFWPVYLPSRVCD